VRLRGAGDVLRRSHRADVCHRMRPWEGCGLRSGWVPQQRAHQATAELCLPL